MKLKEVKELLQAEVLTGEECLENEIDSVFASDFMSDILAFLNDEKMLLTGMVNPQVIRTAEMVDINTIIFVRGKVPDEEMLAMAKEADITVLATKMHMYEACGILYVNKLGVTEE